MEYTISDLILSTITAEAKISNINFKEKELIELLSLEDNRSRGEAGGRSLRPSIIVRTWNQVNKNIDTFKNMFGGDFILVNNDPEGVDKTYNEKEVKNYFDQVTAAREFSDEEKAKKETERKEIETSIKQLLSDLPEFTPQSQIKSKIERFQQN